jgi:hypothetical protein
VRSEAISVSQDDVSLPPNATIVREKVPHGPHAATLSPDEGMRGDRVAE